MDCPACGSVLRQRDSKGGSLFLLCSKWPECQIAGTPTLMNRFDFLREEVTRLESRLTESRAQISRLLKKMEESARDKPEPEFKPSRVAMPTLIGHIAGPVARMRALRSKLSAAKTSGERAVIRAEAREMRRELIREWR